MKVIAIEQGFYKEKRRNPGRKGSVFTLNKIEDFSSNWMKVKESTSAENSQLMQHFQKLETASKKAKKDGSFPPPVNSEELYENAFFVAPVKIDPLEQQEADLSLPPDADNEGGESPEAELPPGSVPSKVQKGKGGRPKNPNALSTPDSKGDETPHGNNTEQSPL